MFLPQDIVFGRESLTRGYLRDGSEFTDMHVILYTRSGCHLCDLARDTLESHGLTVDCIDIDSDPKLLAKYNHCIPVVAIDGKVRFRGRVQPVLLRRLMKANAKHAPAKHAPEEEPLSESMHAPATQLGVFAKYWAPGKVKTRLAADIGADAAADLYRVFVETTLAKFRGAADRCVLCFSPSESAGEFRDVFPDGWELEPQSQGDLGERMEHYFESAFARGARRVLLIGSDSPDLPTGCIEQAFNALDNDETSVVLGPSGDGGYYLVGAKDKTPPIFSGIDWSTGQVWQQTVDRLAVTDHHHKSGYATVPAWDDVDTIADLRELHDRLLRQKDRHTEPMLPQLINAIEQALLG